ncbi:uncharacterized protein BKA55DRAFT_650606 [Fusarium redolens]|uniref:DUF7730 domain-containing protein n=1 Tax=Fusarium redolens TaxID=48865 RepID=A0A9P9GEJ7_FUSRE|nr:uncharacterized protein BKA55DRAFT_650606 [Fusarium redolens]KAH7237471.1 hypothetical protein BKA55DRAFT_650606 [Fusarium redolens]
MEPRFCAQWQSLQKRSRLFAKLDWELRFRIYCELFGRSRVHVALFESKDSNKYLYHPKPTGCWRYRRCDEGSSPRVPDESLFLPNSGQCLEGMNIIYTCQRVYNEALPILLSNTLVLHDPKQFRLYVHHCPFSENVKETRSFEIYCSFQLSEPRGVPQLEWLTDIFPGPLYSDQFTPRREITLHLYGVQGKGANTEYRCTPEAKERFLRSLRRFMFRSTVGGHIFLPGKSKESAREMALMCFQEKRFTFHSEDIRHGQDLRQL